jgi:DNA-binding CsgD family transcriptional regulator
MLPPRRAVRSLQAAKASYAGLTRREREVASLIAAGKSNRAIADALETVMNFYEDRVDLSMLMG